MLAWSPNEEVGRLLLWHIKEFVLSFIYIISVVSSENLQDPKWPFHLHSPSIFWNSVSSHFNTMTSRALLSFLLFLLLTIYAYCNIQQLLKVNPSFSFSFLYHFSLHRWTPWTHRLYQLPRVPFLSIQHGSSPIWLWLCTKDILTSRPTMTSPCQISGPLLHTWTLLVLSWLIIHSFSKSCLPLATLSSPHRLTILSWTNGPRMGKKRNCTILLKIC